MRHGPSRHGRRVGTVGRFMKAGMRYLCVKQSQSVVHATNFGSIDLGIPTAIGAAIGARIGPRLRWSVTAGA